MEPYRISTKITVKQCTGPQCQERTEYYCHSCQKDFCQHCKVLHGIDLDTKNHEVTIYREKYKCLKKHETCMIHSDRVYTMYCEPCEIPVCDSCSEHNQLHTLQNVLDIRTVYQTKRQQHKKMIHNLHSETLYNRSSVLKRLKSDVNSDLETCHRKISQGQSEMEKRGQKLNNLMDRELIDVIKYEETEYIKWCLNQKGKMTRYLSRIRHYEDRYNHLAYKPVNFLRFIKKVRLPRIRDTPHLTQHRLISLTQEIIMRNLIELLSDMQITERGNRNIQEENELLLTHMRSPELKKSLIVNDIAYCGHISVVTPDRVWVSDHENQLILTDTKTGNYLCCLDDSINSWTGLHTVNNECELIYIDKNKNIKKLSSNMKRNSTFIEKPVSPWTPLCVYCSPTTGDLLVAMHRQDTTPFTGQVRRYNKTGKLTQTIPHNTHTKLYSVPSYITENYNGDVVVSDSNYAYRDAVVVTDRGGRQRFVYLGPPSGPRLQTPRGIATDALSHILVIDMKNGPQVYIHMLNKDGEFLSYLELEKPPGQPSSPVSLSYDVNTHLMWVASVINTVSVYRHVNRHLDITDDVAHCDIENIPAVETIYQRL